MQALGYQAAADPVVRAGTNGMFYYAGLAFNRGTGGLSSVFVSRLMDLNNQENGDPIAFIDTQVVATGNASQFLDKPAMAVDIPRSGASTCTFNFPGVNNTVIHQSFLAGNVFVTYTDFLAASKDNATPTHLMFTRSTNCGQTWSKPIQLNTGTTTSQGSAIAVNPVGGNVFVAWRQFQSTGVPDAIMIAESTNAGKTFRTPVRISTFTPFDQGTSETSFRTNAYPSITMDGFGIVYVAFSARGVGPGGDARVVVTGSLDGSHWIPPIPVDNPRQNSDTNPSGRGHQIMPAISFANGRLTLLYYDLRLDHYVDFFNPNPSQPGQYIPTLVPEGELPTDPAEVFTQYVDDNGLKLRRHTIDLRVLQLGLFPIPAFGPSVLVSQYAYGCCFDGSNIEQFKFNPPNLPLFGQGTEPFLGDYIDIVPSPQFVPSGSSWAYNMTPSANPTFHAAWTDNRDVVPPADGNWENYTPPLSASLGTKSLFDPNQSPPACQVGQEGMRNQNIYTAQITGGLIVGAPGNSKPLGTTTNPVTGKSALFQRAFPVEAQNLTNLQKFFRFTIQNQPTGGKASFLQFSQLTTLDLTVPALSSVSRSVFVTSTNAHATITVSVAEINQIGGSPVRNGLTASTILNPDITNPSITNPSITNPSITNPSITNSEVTNPSITNPSITNPSITNPSITNPDITNPSITNPSITNQSAENPSITNPSITNPDITNPSITNPSITNPDITNGSIADVSYPITNNGNTTSTYTVKLADTTVPPNGIVLQMIVNRPYQTPAANNCELTTENHWVTVANIVNPALFSAADPNLSNPDITNSVPNEASITLAPGETAYITVRLVNPSPATIPFTADTLISTIFPATVPQAVNTQTVFQTGGNPVNPPLALLITTPSLPSIPFSSTYSQQLQWVGGVSGTHTWTIVAGSLPTGLGLNSATGLISGTPTQAGSFAVTIQLQDSASPPDTTTANYTLVVNAPLAPMIGTTSLPNGKYNSPYTPLVLSATGGTAPYTWSVGQGGVLPVGMTLDPTSGTFSGAPAQAGLWSIPFTVTDSNSLTAGANLSLTVNLATAYAGSQNCYMPYPTTPMFYQGASGSWSVTAPGSLSGQMTFVPGGNALTGCLSGSNGSISSGSYQLQFTVGNTTFSLPLPVVAQDTQDNGTYSVNSGGVGNLPPSGFQQGVVTPSQAFNYAPGSYSADDNSTQNDQFLFGFSGSGPQVCGSIGGLSDGFTLNSPAQPGRFDILFDGSTQGCPQSAFPTTPAPIVIASVDAVGSSVTWSETTTSSVQLSSSNPNAFSAAGNVLEIEAGGTSPNPVTVAFNYSIYNDPSCPSCIDQIEIGLNTEASPQACAYSGIPPLSPGVSGSASITINVPNTPGRYYIGMDRSEDYSCLQSTPYWWSGPPPASRYIGVVDVWSNVSY
ncbi:MAG: putative Ig domain-containing protein [Terriglobales bacterium]